MMKDHNQFTLASHSIDLSKKPLVKRLFSVFSSEPGKSINPDTLVQEIYDIRPYPEVSQRLWVSKRQSLTKLISRSRHLANKSFAPTNSSDVQWFPYNKKLKCWTFYEKPQDS